MSESKELKARQGWKKGDQERKDMEAHLLNCPFCGSVPYAGPHRHFEDKFGVCCGGSDAECIFPSSGPRDTLEEAMALWQNRHRPAADDGLVEAAFREGYHEGHSNKGLPLAWSESKAKKPSTTEDKCRPVAHDAARTERSEG